MKVINKMSTVIQNDEEIAAQVIVSEDVSGDTVITLVHEGEYNTLKQNMKDIKQNSVTLDTLIDSINKTTTAEKGVDALTLNQKRSDYFAVKETVEKAINTEKDRLTNYINVKGDYFKLEEFNIKQGNILVLKCFNADGTRKTSGQVDLRLIKPFDGHVDKYTLSVQNNGTASIQINYSQGVYSGIAIYSGEPDTSFFFSFIITA